MNVSAVMVEKGVLCEGRGGKGRRGQEKEMRKTKPPIMHLYLVPGQLTAVPSSLPFLTRLGKQD